MANTTNYNWATPDDTDLVKDGASAIRTLGSSIDTSFVDLLGGTTDQVLSKASATNLDFTWSSPVLQQTKMISGEYYLSPESSVTGSTAVVNVTYYLPIFIPFTTTFDRIACMSFTSFVGTASIRLAIYNNTDGKPSTVLLDAGTVAVTAASTMSQITISQSLSPGIYFLAANTVTAASTNTFYSYQNSEGNPLLGASRATIATANAYEGFVQNVNVTSGFATAVSPSLSTTLSTMTAIRAV